MKKRLMLLSCLLVSCSINGFVVRNCINHETSTSFSSQYDYFSGNKNYQININEDKKTIKVKITSLEGTLSVRVYDNSTSHYEGNIDYDFDFTINLNKGKYKVSLTADEHKGSYSFSW